MSQEDQLTCRICSAPAEADQPLFHPCKCSGTIRYIHQDCLKTWLAHSKKKTCDICKHPYSFTKVYAPDMPERLPFVLLMRQFSRQSWRTVLFCIRAALVATVWLALLPWATIWTWRMYFAMGDSTAWWISNRPRPSPGNATEDLSLVSPGVPRTTTWLSHPIVRSISSDIVSGQIIASLIVLAFVAIFLLREWISQNARPGIFEDADPVADNVLPAAAPLPEPLDPPPALIEEQQLVDIPMPAAFDPIPVPPVRTENGQVEGDMPQTQGNGDETPSKKLRRDTENGEGRVLTRKPPARVTRDKGKRIERRERAVGAGPSRLRRRTPFRDSSESAEEDTRDPLVLDDEKTRFTFRASTQASQGNDVLHAVRPRKPHWALSNPSASSDISTWTPHIVPRPRESDVQTGSPQPSSTNLNALGDTTPPALQTDASTPAHEDLPQDTPIPIIGSSSPAPAVIGSEGDTSASAGMSASLTASSSLADTSGGLRRPPLPSFTLPSPSAGLPPTPGVSFSRGQTPLASPSLATYSAPEQFEAGPSTHAGYFGPMADDRDEDMAEEHKRYFTTEEDMHNADKLEEEGDVDEGNHSSVLSEHEEAEGPPAPVDVEAPQPAAEGDGPQPHPEAARRAAEAVVEIGARLEELNQQLDAIQANMDENLDDEVDGALEAIGLRGPLFAVIQNAALMTFILDVTIGLGIWAPFTVGKSAALLSLDPPRLLYVLNFPLRIIRLVTDPIVDLVALLFTQIVLPPIYRILSMVTRPLLDMLSGPSGAGGSSSAEVAGPGLFEQCSDLVSRVGGDLLGWRSSTPSDTNPKTSILENVMERDFVFYYVEPYFAPLGSRIRATVEELKSTWTRLTVGDGPNEKAFAILLGYVVMGLMLALYLNILTIGNVKNAGKAVRNAVRQQLLVIKVAAFIFVELVIFPLGCGVMLDACTVWLLPQGNFRSRAAFLTYAPVTSVFYHWVIGTMFMYQFAILLAGCRDIMRPGSMWFIKDPQDQNFHPIRDILERPTLVQMRKLIISAAMYGVVVAAGVGTVSGVLQCFSRTILPLRWKIREPLSPVPVDLLFLHLVLPYTMQYFRPKKILRQIGVHLWKYLASQLRLSSYMFGGRHEHEEYTPWRWRLDSLFVLPNAWATRHPYLDRFDGTFRRVPNSDNVALVKDMPATVGVDASGIPVDAKQADIMEAQNIEAEKQKRSIKDDYMVVYLPPNLKYRIVAFISLVWFVGSVMLALGLGAPIILGRMVFKLFTPHDVHDGYSFIAGFYLFWACYIVSYSVERMDKRRQRRSGSEPRAEWPLYLAKRILLWVAQVSYMVLFLGLVIPTLLALVMEFYVVQPIRQITSPPKEHRIRIVDMWAIGLLYAKIFIRVLQMQPNNNFIRGIDLIARGGWTHIDPFRATRQVIAPLTFGLLGMLLLPAGVLWSLRRLIRLPIGDDFLFVHVYPSIFTLASFGHSTLVAFKIIGSWSQTIRDKEFLVEMRLQNHELEPETAKSEATGTGQLAERATVNVIDPAEDADVGAELGDAEEEEED